MPLPLDTPPPIGPRGLALRVSIQGQDAQAAGAQLNACPYGPDRPYSRRAWVAGYAAAALEAGLVDPVALDEDVPEVAPWPGDTAD